MILALSITLAVLAVLALGILAYFKFFALVYDKDGISVLESVEYTKKLCLHT